jgi:hypothetical protein
MASETRTANFEMYDSSCVTGGGRGGGQYRTSIACTRMTGGQVHTVQTGK